MSLAMILGFLACKGSEGKIGPQGSLGPVGPQGVTGPVGPAGQASMYTSAWLKVTSTMWVANQDSSYYLVTHEDATITQPILEKGLVMAYYRNAGRPGVVFALPSVTDELALGFFMQVQNGKGFMNFDLIYSKLHKTPIDFDLEFRWIIIPPNPGGRLKTFDWNDYEQVKQELGLAD